MRGRGRGHQNFDAGVRGGVGGGSSEGGGASLLGAVCVNEVLPVPSKDSSSGGVIEIEIEIVYNMYRMRRFSPKSRMRRLLSLGPPNYAIQGTYKSGLDREPPMSNLSKCGRGFHSPPGRV